MLSTAGACVGRDGGDNGADTSLPVRDIGKTTHRHNVSVVWPSCFLHGEGRGFLRRMLSRNIALLIFEWRSLSSAGDGKAVGCAESSTLVLRAVLVPGGCHGALTLRPIAMPYLMFVCPDRRLRSAPDVAPQL